MRRVAGETFPVLVEEPGSVAEGLLLRHVSEAGLARMDYYEAGFGYTLAPIDVQATDGKVAACVYRKDGETPETGATWVLDEWVRDWGALTCTTAEEIMCDMERRPAGEIARRIGPLRARAQARLNAREAAPTTLRHRAEGEDVRLIRRTLAYADFFSVEEYDLTHRRFSGTHGAPMSRTAFVSGDAVTVLPYDPVRDRVLLVEQFRTGPFARGDSQPWLLEPIAGRIDGGETAEDCARREAEEEAGICLRHLQLVGQYYPTPGAKSEYLYGYVGLADLPDEAAGLGGLEAEAEDIRSHVVSFGQAMALVESGEINVGPLILLLLQLDRLRPGLRAAAGLG